MPPMLGSRRFLKAQRAAMSAEEKAADGAARLAKLQAGRAAAAARKSAERSAAKASAKAARSAIRAAARECSALQKAKAAKAAKASLLDDAMRVVSRAVRHLVLEPDLCHKHHYVGRRELVDAVRAFLSREWREGSEYVVSAADAKLGGLLASPQTPLNLQRLVFGVLVDEEYLRTHNSHVKGNGDMQVTRVLDPESNSERVAVWMGIRLAGRAPPPNAKSEAKKKSN
jgi:hypothetical protein